MPITITITADTPDEARSLMAGFLGNSSLGGATISTANTGTASPAPRTVPTMLAPAPLANGTTDDDDDDSAPATPIEDGALDADGLPWDVRIHSGSKAQTNDGKWRKLKGVDKSIIPGVEAELRARSAPPAAPIAAMPAPLAAPAPVPPMPAPVAAPAPAPAPMPAPLAAPTPVPSAPQTDPTDFHGFMQRISLLMGADKPVNPDYLTQLAARIGAGYQVEFPAITGLQEKPEYIKYAIDLMKHDGVWA